MGERICVGEDGKERGEGFKRLRGLYCRLYLQWMYSLSLYI